MFYRGCMRRGVSLEVIVEEEDGAQVSFDPLSTPVDDISLSSPSSSEREEKSNDFESENKISQEDNSQDEEEGEEVGGGRRRNCQHKLKEEKRKRKRKKAEWRMLLERRRSVSCETLTVLDVGDDKASQEDWAEEAKAWESLDDPFNLHTSQTISRKKILLSCTMASQDSTSNHQQGHQQANYGGHLQSQQASETNKGISESAASASPFAAAAGDHSGNGSSITRCDTEKRLHCSAACEGQSDLAELTEKGQFSECQEQVDLGQASQIDANGSCLEQFELEYDDKFSSEDDSLSHYDFVDIRKEADRWQRDPFSSEKGGWVDSKQLPRTDPQGCECPDEEEIAQVHHEDDQNLLSVNSGKQLFENDQPSKTTERQTQALVFALFGKAENALENQSVTLVEKEQATSSEVAWELHQNRLIAPNEKTPRNKEMHPEELPKPHTVASVRQLFEGMPLQRARFKEFQTDHSYGLFDHVRSNPSSKILRFERDRQTTRDLERVDGNHGEKSTPNKERHRSTTEISNANGSCRKADGGREVQKEAKRMERDPAVWPSGNLTLKPTKSRHSAVIHLRKPTVARNFNVQKALQDNPRDFHVKVSRKAHLNGNNGQINNNPGINSIEIVSSANRKANKGHLAMDRSDSESWTSESSEDSGVLKDFNSSSILSSFCKSSGKAKSTGPPKTYDKHSDPSFKWIDPRVLAKIRSVGTTVIFFGPRYQAKKTLVNRTRWKPLEPSSEKNTNLSQANSRLDAPRIVGVVPKILPKSILRKTQGPPLSDSTWRRSCDSTVLYDFTRRTKTLQQSPEGCG